MPEPSTARAGRAPVRRPATAEARAAKQRVARRRRIVLAALLFPLIFFVVIVVGLVAMHHGRGGMELFRPAPSSDG